VGIMDHDSLAGAQEFIEAGRILKIATTIGFEIRTDWSDTPFANARLNNPDQIGCAYICVHGIPHQNIGKAEKFLEEIRKARNERNRKMTAKLNEYIEDTELDFDRDIVPISYSECGGSITERHILYAFAKKIIEKTKTRKKLIKYLGGTLKLELDSEQTGYLEDEKNDTYDYDLLNILKKSFISRMYIDAEYPELIPVTQIIDFARKIGAIPAYAYLGDVEDSVTGDKKAQKFEDDYIDDLMKYNKEIGFDAVAYMPSRNSVKQLAKVKELCRKYELFQINGEDINQPRQSFICKELKDEEYIHLIDNTWALIGHEILATEDISKGMFSEKNRNEKLGKRIDTFSVHGFNFSNK